VPSDTFKLNIVEMPVDYLAGRQIGYYWPSLPPTYLKKNDENKKMRIDYMNIMKEELFQKIC
jgi:hypothetical protein